MNERSHSSDSQPTGSVWSVYPFPLDRGERPLIFTHEQYRSLRTDGRLDEYDILMLQPSLELEPGEREPDEDKRWQPVAARKYLKYRALEWREADQISDLPERWQDRAEQLETLIAERSWD